MYKAHQRPLKKCWPSGHPGAITCRSLNLQSTPTPDHFSKLTCRTVHVTVVRSTCRSQKWKRGTEHFCTFLRYKGFDTLPSVSKTCRFRRNSKYNHHDTTLHSKTLQLQLHCITLRCTALHYITLRYSTLYYTGLHYQTRQSITLY